MQFPNYLVYYFLQASHLVQYIRVDFCLVYYFRQASHLVQYIRIDFVVCNQIYWRQKISSWVRVILLFSMLFKKKCQLVLLDTREK